MIKNIRKRQVLFHLAEFQNVFLFYFGENVLFIFYVTCYIICLCRKTFKQPFTERFYRIFAKFFVKDFLSKSGHIRSFLRIWSHLLKKSSMESSYFVQSNTDVLISCCYTFPKFYVRIQFSGRLRA